MSSTTVTRGNLHESFIISPTLTPTALGTTATTSLQTYPIAGLQVGDIVTLIGYQGNQTAGVVVTEADVLTNGVLTIQWGNLISGTALTPAAGVYNIRVDRLEGPAPTNAA